MSRIGAEFSQLFNLDNLWSALMRLEDHRLTFTERTSYTSAIDARQKFQMFHPMVSAGLDVRVDCLYREKRTKKLEKPAFWRQWCL
ncbi:Hypothetical predicted protein [Cloeon dipterum]|uniref:Uncharacterized protein n=1 Tax=Cloeon dipterum TaxID=197152 RepID=A0A8S1DNV9_9INSE|nr:Hypothetical predicted protein [Cloeon dipterum]